MPGHSFVKLNSKPVSAGFQSLSGIDHFLAILLRAK